ncbi:MAG: hypothetical protein CMF26_04020 [Kiloniella sp.]|nr:hypothetical protein [Kiloniella sp.]RZO30569.1 MAG: periplasmic heavy metal sensor [Rhodospirillaceae bacterium]
MTRILGLTIVLLLALCIGLSAALFTTGQDARRDIMRLSADLHSRPFQGDGQRDDRRNGNDNLSVDANGESDHPNRKHGVGSFKEVRERLNLSPNQAQMLRQVLKNRRDLRKSMVQALQDSQADFQVVMTAETFDRGALTDLRDKLVTPHRSAGDAAFGFLLDFLGSLSTEQRQTLFELAKDKPNALLFL